MVFIDGLLFKPTTENWDCWTYILIYYALVRRRRHTRVLGHHVKMSGRFIRNLNRCKEIYKILKMIRVVLNRL